MDERFLSALIPARRKVCGVTLPPFSLWHAALLHAAESRLLTAPDQAVRGDLLAALALCQTRFGQSPKLSLSWRWLWRRLRLRGRRFDRALTDFADWMEDHSSAPDLRRAGPACPGRETGLEHILTVAVALMRHLHFPESDAWNMSYGRALWYYAAIAVSEDESLSVMTTGKESEYEAIARALAEMDAPDPAGGIDTEA